MQLALLAVVQQRQYCDAPRIEVGRDEFVFEHEVLIDIDGSYYYSILTCYLYFTLLFVHTQACENRIIIVCLFVV